MPNNHQTAAMPAAALEIQAGMLHRVLEGRTAAITETIRRRFAGDVRDGDEAELAQLRADVEGLELLCGDTFWKSVQLRADADRAAALEAGK